MTCLRFPIADTSKCLALRHLNRAVVTTTAIQLKAIAATASRWVCLRLAEQMKPDDRTRLAKLWDAGC